MALNRFDFISRFHIGGRSDPPGEALKINEFSLIEANE